MSGPGGDGTEEAPERSTYNQPEGHLVSAFLQLPVNVSKGEPRTGFASGYDWADIHDKRGEGLSLAWPRISHTNNAAPQQTSRYSTHTRISLPCRPYAPESPARLYIALLSRLLRSQFALPHAAAIVVLGPARPRCFLEDLNRCLVWIEHCVQGDEAHRLEIIVGDTLNAVRLSFSGPSPPLGVLTYPRHHAS